MSHFRQRNLQRPSTARLATGLLACAVMLHATAMADQPLVFGDVPMADYLALLSRISPAAHQGALAYVHATEKRCRRTMTSQELRQAMADGNGDPTLMAMIRASHLRDGQGLVRLAEQVVCPQRGQP